MVSCSTTFNIRGLRAEANKTGKVVYENDFKNSPWNKFMPEGHVALKNVLFAPLTIDNKTVGLMGIANKKSDFCENDALIAMAFGELAAISFQKSQIKKNLANPGKATQAIPKNGGHRNVGRWHAHDFNNILFPIITFTELLLATAPKNDEDLHEGLNEVLAAALRAKDLVKHILTFSRHTETERHPIKVQLVIKEVIKLMRSSIPSTIKIKNHINPKCGRIFADPTNIHQIVMNLMTNAYHAMEEEGGTMEVALDEVEIPPDDLSHYNLDIGRYACFSVTDTGTGIEQAFLNRIFEPYFTTKNEIKGTGLGLSVVHGIIKSLNGDIEV